jgi:hypothetical protein
MALVKTFTGNEIGSTNSAYFLGYGTGTNGTDTNYITYLGVNNYALVEDPNQDDLYFAESSNDSLTLVPNYDKELTFKNVFKSNLRHGFSSKLLFTSKPTLNARFNFRTIESDEETYSTQISNRSFKNNLDLEDAYLGGNFQQKQVGDQLYTFLSIPTQNNTPDSSSTNTTAPTGNVVIIKGNDYSTAEYITFNTTDAAFDILTVDTTNRIIYLGAVRSSYRDAQSGEYIFSNYAAEALYALTYKTVDTDGVFEFDQLIPIVLDRNYFTSTANEGAMLTISYMGEITNNPCFMLTHNTASDLTTTGLTTTQLGIQFLKINSNQVRTTTTYTLFATISSGKGFDVLDCLDDSHLLTLPADPATPGDYADQQHNVTPSKGHNFNDATPQVFWFYLPYFSNEGNLKLTALKWDKGQNIWTNAFTLYPSLNQTIQVDNEAAGVTQNSFPAFQPKLVQLANYGSLYEAYCSAYITNTNKLHLTFNHIDNIVYSDLNPHQFNNTLSFSIDQDNPETISWETISTIPSLNSMVLKDYTEDTYDELVVLSHDSCRFYTYNSLTGWILAHSELGTFSEFTQDSRQRRWAIEAPADTGYDEIASTGYFYSRLYNSKLHLISEVLPYSTSIEFQNTNVTYNNQTVNNNLSVNAFDQSGNRIETSVLLTIQGTNMVFDTANNSTQRTITTSANSDKIVAVHITGPGYVNVSASFNLQ